MTYEQALKKAYECKNWSDGYLVERNGEYEVAYSDEDLECAKAAGWKFAGGWKQKTQADNGSSYVELTKTKIHQLKILDCFADEIIAGNKMFELRKNDRGYQKGDYICFTVISDESGREIKHAINTRLYEITCVLSGWGLMDGYVALGIREANHEAD